MLLWIRNILNGLLILGIVLAIPLSLMQGQGFLLGVALALGYALPWIGGMGMRGSFKVGSTGQKLAGFIVGLGCLVLGTWLLTLHPYSASFWWWGLLLFGWGFLTVSKSDTTADEPTT